MIKIDTTKAVVDFLRVVPSKEQSQSAQAAIASLARTEWVRLAQAGLSSTARDYIQGIGEVEDRGKVHAVVLTGVLPNMVEKGWNARDLRDSLLGPNSKRRTKKDGGYYNIIPFRHGTPGTTGRNVGPAMPRSIHAAAKSLSPYKAGSLKRNESLHAGMPMSAVAKKILTTKKHEHHTSPIHAGMVRTQQAKSAGGGTSGYTTFRVISSDGDLAKWKHPGIEARGFVKKVAQYVKRMGPTVLAEHLRGG